MGAKDLETRLLSGNDFLVMARMFWILRRKGWDERWHSVAGWVDKTGKSNAEGRSGVRSAVQIRKALRFGLRVCGPIRGHGQSMAASAVAEVRGGSVGGDMVEVEVEVEARSQDGLEKEVKMCFSLGWAPCAWCREHEHEHGLELELEPELELERGHGHGRLGDPAPSGHGAEGTHSGRQDRLLGEVGEEEEEKRSGGGKGGKIWVKETGVLSGDVQNTGCQDGAVCTDGPRCLDGIPSQRLLDPQKMGERVHWMGDESSLEHCVARMYGQDRWVTVFDPSIDGPFHLESL